MHGMIAFTTIGDIHNFGSDNDHGSLGFGSTACMIYDIWKLEAIFGAKLLQGHGTTLNFRLL